MDWDKIRVFKAVAQAGSLTHAGDTLKLSQSAVSRQINALEKDLNSKLFHRHARGLIVTEQGELLLATAEKMEKHFDSGRAKIRDADGNLSRSGKAANLTNRMVTLVNKLFNKVPNLLQDIQLGIVNKPLDEYTTEFESGLIDGGEYVSGQITEDADTVSIIDSSTYSPLTDQDTVVDADLYINI